MVRARTIATVLKVPTPKDFLDFLRWEHDRITQPHGGNLVSAADTTEEATPAPKLHLDSVGQAGLTIAGINNLKGNQS